MKRQAVLAKIVNNRKVTRCLILGLCPRGLTGARVPDMTTWAREVVAAAAIAELIGPWLDRWSLTLDHS